MNIKELKNLLTLAENASHLGEMAPVQFWHSGIMSNLIICERCVKHVDIRNDINTSGTLCLELMQKPIEHKKVLHLRVFTEENNLIPYTSYPIEAKDIPEQIENCMKLYPKGRVDFMMIDVMSMNG